MGNVGAGTGATVGKAMGREFAMNGGVGTASVSLENGVIVAAIAVVNALGDIYDSATGRLLAGAKKDGKIIPSARAITENLEFGNTTIGVIATNARLTREQCNKLASLAHDGLALAIRPVHTSMDGDTFFALSTGELENRPFLPIQAVAAEVVSRAIADAVSHGA